MSSVKVNSVCNQTFSGTLGLSEGYMRYNLTIIGSDNGPLPCRHQAIIWNNAGILSIRPLGTNFSKILIHENASEDIVCEEATILSRGGGGGELTGNKHRCVGSCDMYTTVGLCYQMLIRYGDALGGIKRHYGIIIWKRPRPTGPLSVDYHRWITSKKASYAKLWFLQCLPERDVGITLQWCDVACCWVLRLDCGSTFCWEDLYSICW